jgi:hypothetical protein
MRCGAKAWGSWAEALADHRTFLAAWPRILGAYVGPWSLGALQIEAMMITINSVNQCTFCSGLHCELGRMAGIPQPLRLNQAKTAEECTALSGASTAEHRAAVAYARAFAVCDGRGKREAQAFVCLVQELGIARARSVRALCWFLYWGSYTGNTLNGALGYRNNKPGASESFLAQFLAYYAFLFCGVLTTVSLALKALPRVPGLVSAMLGVVLTVLAGAAFAPLGLLGVLLGAKSVRSLHRQGSGAFGARAPVRCGAKQGGGAVRAMLVVVVAGFVAIMWDPRRRAGIIW